jgi:tagaturonate reductase|tara:strand:- start:10857 stop:11033 length:177 start_codon:yes stop_codon:yes gene_type:complete
MKKIDAIGYAFQELNKTVGFNAGIAVVQPIDKGLIKMLNDKDGSWKLQFSDRKTLIYI